MQFFFCPSPSHRDDGSRGGKVFTILTLFARVAGHTARLPSWKLPFWALTTAYLRPGRSKWDTVKGKIHPHDVDNAGKDGGRVQLHQDGQAPFHGQFVPIRPVSAVFSAKEANQTTGLGVVSVGKGYGTDRVDLWSGWPPVLKDSNSRLRGQGASWRGKLPFKGTSAWQKFLSSSGPIDKRQKTN